MTIELSPSDAKLLNQLLHDQVRRIEDELVHTDRRDLQREIATDVTRLRDLIGRLGLG